MCSLTWICTSQLEIPIRSQLSAVIFENSMRMQNLKGSSDSARQGEKVADEEKSVLEPCVKHETDDEDLTSLLSEDSYV
jgi:hypothetical protein